MENHLFEPSHYGTQKLWNSTRWAWDKFKTFYRGAPSGGLRLPSAVTRRCPELVHRVGRLFSGADLNSTGNSRRDDEILVGLIFAGNLIAEPHSPCRQTGNLQRGNRIRARTYTSAVAIGSRPGTRLSVDHGHRLLDGVLGYIGCSRLFGPRPPSTLSRFFALRGLAQRHSR
jgi:hypothetical protein